MFIAHYSGCRTITRCIKTATFVAFAVASAVAAPEDPEPLSLASDKWQFEVDRNDRGIEEQWWTRTLEDRVKLPGSMTENGLGDEISTSTPWTQEQPRLTELFAAPELQQYFQPGKTKIPFWLTPLKYYKGAAWYQRDFTVPQDWADKGVTLHLERPHWRTDVWVDGEFKGYRDSLSTPHEYLMGRLEPGSHRLTIRVDNRVQTDVGLNAHSITDHTQGNWNGIVGDIELRPRQAYWATNVQVYPDAENRSVRVVAVVEGSTLPDSIEVQITRRNSDEVIASAQSPIESLPEISSPPTVETTVQLDGQIDLWDEFNPNLYEARVQFIDGGNGGTNADSAVAAISDVEGENNGEEKTIVFGFRDFATSGTEFTVNGRSTFLRGTLECCIFPLTGYPPMEIGEWRRIMKVLKAHGLNHLRFHSWCPPEAAFDAADEAGVYFSIECASWSKSVGDADYMKWLYDESRRIVDEFGNHPSFCMFLYGNEPAGKTKKIYMDALDEFVGYWDKREDRFLISGGAGWPWLPNNEFYITQEPRIQHWGEGLKSRVNSRPPETETDYHVYVQKFEEPVISHEIGQWCAYPNLDERSKYTGVMRALNFDIFEDTLTKHHMRHLADDFLKASGKLQALLYKEDIESALRTKGMGGFQLLDLHDFPGQGTALVGVLDPFWDSKGYITAQEYRSFSGPVVPLARLSKRVFTNDEELTCSVEFANYGAAAKSVTPEWKLVREGGEVLASGKLAQRDFPLGNGIQFGEIRQPLDKITEAEKLVLEINLDLPEAVNVPNLGAIKNSWDIWVYPKDVTANVPENVLLTRTLNAAAMDKLKTGGTVLLVPERDAVLNDPDKPLIPGFSSIFWNTAWTGNQAPHTLGILCDPAHPALAKFPTDSHSNWQWWYLVHNSPVMILDALKPEMLPIVQVIDDWTTNRKLGSVLEARYGGGMLLVCTLPIADDTAHDPVTRQMRRSLLDYAASEKFDPKETLTKDQLQQILKLD